MVTSQILPPQPEWLHPEHKERREIHGWIVDPDASLFVVAAPRKDLRLEAYKLKVRPTPLPWPLNTNSMASGRRPRRKHAHMHACSCCRGGFPLWRCQVAANQLQCHRSVLSPQQDNEPRTHVAFLNVGLI